MKRNVSFIVLSVILAVLGIVLWKSRVPEKPAIPGVPAQTKEVADYYREDVYKFKPSDFDSEPVDFALSNLVDGVSVVKLDNENSDALLNGRAFPFFTRTYIGVQSDDLPFKLFDRATGKFIRNIGAIGQGPGEYQWIYHVVMDEENDRIYLNCTMDPGILEYDFAGNFLKKIHIPGVDDMRKIRFTVQDSMITSFVMTFEGDTSAVITSGKNEKLISTAPAKVFMAPSFDMELFIQTNTPYTGYAHTASSVYYNYDSQTCDLVPAFAFEKGAFAYVFVEELENCYLFSVDMLNEGKTRLVTDHIVLHDKKSKESRKVNLINDFIGDMPFPIGCFSQGMFIHRMTASDFREKAKEALKKKTLGEDKKQFLSGLMNSMSDDDNDIIVYAPLK